MAIEYRCAENQADRLPALATDLVRRRVAVIVAPSPTAALVAPQLLGWAEGRDLRSLRSGQPRPGGCKVVPLVR